MRTLSEHLATQKELRLKSAALLLQPASPPTQNQPPAANVVCPPPPPPVAAKPPTFNEELNKIPNLVHRMTLHEEVKVWKLVTENRSNLMETCGRLEKTKDRLFELLEIYKGKLNSLVYNRDSSSQTEEVGNNDGRMENNRLASAAPVRGDYLATPAGRFSPLVSLPWTTDKNQRSKPMRREITKLKGQISDLEKMNLRLLELLGVYQKTLEERKMGKVAESDALQEEESEDSLSDMEASSDPSSSFVGYQELDDRSIEGKQNNSQVTPRFQSDPEVESDNAMEMDVCGSVNPSSEASIGAVIPILSVPPQASLPAVSLESSDQRLEQPSADVGPSKVRVVDKPFLCSQCDRGYAYPWNLKRHVKKFHKKK
ncbi:unnamed protein product [Orchesella dallaii]|uniref:C2H2-type domain-containing protein n=1 Tax=Orchesella dallaii TaxID=48710 RepID=A0ABP1Q3R9_9HEXA